MLTQINMKFLAVPLLLASAALAADMGMSIHGGAYNFGYHTGDAGGHSRVESGNGHSVSGSYSYVDPNGDHRTVHYSAGPGGYHASGDIGVDRKTAAAAAAIAAMAPKAPMPIAHAMHGHAMHAPVMHAANWHHQPHWNGHYGGHLGAASNVVINHNGYAAKW